MKKVTGLVLMMVMMGVLAGCYSTCQPVPTHVSMKGEG